MGPISSLASHAATSFTSAQLAGQVSTAVAGKVQDAAKAEGEAMISLLQDAASVAHQAPSEPGKGNLIDFHV